MLRSRVCQVLTALLPLTFIAGLLGSGSSYLLWAGGGFLFAVLMPVGFVVGLVVLVAEIVTKRIHAIVWPAVLLVVSGVPLLLVILVASTSQS